MATNLLVWGHENFEVHLEIWEMIGARSRLCTFTWKFNFHPIEKKNIFLELCSINAGSWTCLLMAGKRTREVGLLI